MKKYIFILMCVLIILIFYIVNERKFYNLTYCAFGDSITFGYSFEAYNYRMEEPYPKLVAEDLGIKKHINNGINAASLCKNSINRTNMTEIILNTNEEYDIVSVMLGVNDYVSNFPLGIIEDETNETIYGSLNLIAKHFEKYYKNSFVFFITPFQTTRVGGNITDNNFIEYELEDVSNAIKEVAKKYNIPVLDMYNEGKFELYMKNGDGVHPDQAFIKQYAAPKISNFIRKNYK